MNYRPPHSMFSSFREAEMCLMAFRHLSPPAPEARPISTQSDTAPLLNHLKSQKVPAYRKGEHKSEYFQGWRMGIILCAITAGIVLTISVVVTLWGSIKFGVHEALVTIQDGSCDRTRNISLWLHLAINISRTLLLGASNYCM